MTSLKKKNDSIQGCAQYNDVDLKQTCGMNSSKVYFIKGLIQFVDQKPNEATEAISDNIQPTAASGWKNIHIFICGVSNQTSGNT